MRTVSSGWFMSTSKTGGPKASEFSREDLDSLIRRFSRWRHQAVRDESLAFTLTGDPSASEPFRLLAQLCSEPTPGEWRVAGDRDPFERLDEDVIQSICRFLATPDIDAKGKEDLTRRLLMSVEPVLSKLLALVEPDEYRRLQSRQQRGGLATILTILSKKGRIPTKLALTEDEFRSSAGWEERPSYVNAVRDVLLSRLDQAHRSMAPSMYVWDSAVVVLVGAIWTNRADLARFLTCSIGSEEPRPLVANGLPLSRSLPSTAPEPLTTRRPAATAFRARVQEGLESGGRLEVIHGTPGWGKTTFLSMALEDVSAPVRIADISDSSTGARLAEALLEGLDIAPSEQREIDLEPMKAVRVFLSHMRRPTVVILEGLHNSGERAPCGELGAFVRKLMLSGHVVAIESWTSDIESGWRLPQGRIGRLGSAQLVPLAEDEIREWAKRVVGRDLHDREVEILETFDGNPLALRRALEILADRYRVADPEVASRDLMTIARDWRQLQNDFERMICGTSSAGTSEISDAEWCWFGCLPWAHPAVSSLQADDRHRRRYLQSVGLLAIEGDSWRVEPWARILGLRRCIDNPELLHENLPYLLELSQAIPDWGRGSQRRHLARLTPLMKGQKETLLRLIDSIQLEAAPEPALQGPEEPYEAPAEPELVRPELWEGGPALPLDLRLWLLDGASRGLDRDSFALHFERLLALPNLRAALGSDWKLIKGIHRALISSPFGAAQRLVHYRAIIGLCRPAEGDRAHDRAQRTWLARFLIAAAESAQRAGDLEHAARWIAQARDSYEVSAPSSQSWHVQAFTADTAYRIAAFMAQTMRNSVEFLDAHRQALGTIPPLADQMPAWRGLWAERVLSHLQVLAFHGAMSNADVSAVRLAMHNVADDLACLSFAEAFLEASEACDETLAREVRGALRGRLAKFNSSSRQGRRHLAIGRILLDGPPANAATLAAEVSAEMSDGPEREDLVLLKLCVRLSSRDQKLRRPMVAVCVTVLERLRSKFWMTGDEKVIEALRSSCLKFFASHQLAIGSSTFEEDGVGLNNPVRLRDAERRIDGAYAAHFASTGNAWLWDDWCAWKISIVRKRNALERSPSTHKRLGDAAADGLRAFVRKSEAALGDHVAQKVVALRVARYLWDTSESRRLCYALLAEPLDTSRRPSVVSLMADGLSAQILAPDASKSIDSADLTLLIGVLREKVLGTRAVGRRSMLTWLADALEHGTDPSFWNDVAERAAAVLGTPSVYWQSVMSAAEGAVPGMRDRPAIEDLTDPSTLLVASRIFRWGASLPELEEEVRFELAQLAAIASIDADRWFRSMRGRRAFLGSWQVGTALATALLLSRDGVLFGQAHSDEVNRRGQPFTWREIIERELNAACSLALGRFREVCEETRKRLGTALRERELRIASSAT